MTAAEALEVVSHTRLHREADRKLAIAAFAVLEARLAQLEKVAELARDVIREKGPNLLECDVEWPLLLALLELDELSDPRS